MMTERLYPGDGGNGAVALALRDPSFDGARPSHCDLPIDSDTSSGPHQWLS